MPGSQWVPAGFERVTPCRRQTKPVTVTAHIEPPSRQLADTFRKHMLEDPEVREGVDPLETFSFPTFDVIASNKTIYI